MSTERDSSSTKHFSITSQQRRFLSLSSFSTMNPSSIMKSNLITTMRKCIIIMRSRNNNSSITTRNSRNSTIMWKRSSITTKSLNPRSSQRHLLPFTRSRRCSRTRGLA